MLILGKRGGPSAARAIVNPIDNSNPPPIIAATPSILASILAMVHSRLFLGAACRGTCISCLKAVSLNSGNMGGVAMRLRRECRNSVMGRRQSRIDRSAKTFVRASGGAGTDFMR
jgi:hypothetical protein